MLTFLKKQKRRLVRAYYKRKTKSLLKTKDIPCPLCGNNDVFITLWNHDRYGLPITTVRCSSCGLVFTRPFPTEAFLDTFYSSHMFRGLDWGILNVTKKIALEFGAPDRAKKHIAYMSDLIRRGVLKKETFHSILDVGSSEGSFLLQCKESFPYVKTYGVEPGKNFRSLTEKEFTHVYEDIKKVPAEETFDCITLWHVFEHVSNPIAMLSSIQKHMNTDTLLVIEVPDVSRYDGIRAIHIDHTFHYTKETFEQIFQKVGLKLVESTHDNQFLMDDKYGIKVVAQKV